MRVARMRCRARGSRNSSRNASRALPTVRRNSRTTVISLLAPLRRQMRHRFGCPRVYLAPSRQWSADAPRRARPPPPSPRPKATPPAPRCREPARNQPAADQLGVGFAVDIALHHDLVMQTSIHPHRQSGSRGTAGLGRYAGRRGRIATSPASSRISRPSPASSRHPIRVTIQK
jgi:hypothetical protein